MALVPGGRCEIAASVQTCAMRYAPRFLFLTIALLGCRVSFAGDVEDTSKTAAGRIAAIEQRVGGRVGVAALDSGTKRRIEHRANERFAMCSTFKLPLAAAVLHRVDEGKERLDRMITYTEADLLEHAPVTKKNIGEGGMSVEALCDAAMTYSDNTAANLLLATLGGPSGLTNFFAKLGDKVSRLDRNEPTLNDVAPGDPRDTTTPSAMLTSMQALLLGDALTSGSRSKLEDWMARNTTGAQLIRAGVPSDWRVGDKTGRGAQNSINDVAILRAPEGAPILLCIYSSGSKAPVAEREAAVAETAKIVVEALR